MPPRNGRNASSRNPAQPTHLTEKISLLEETFKRSRVNLKGGGSEVVKDVALITSQPSRAQFTFPDGSIQFMSLADIAGRVRERRDTMSKAARRLERVIDIKGVNTSEEFKNWLITETSALQPFRKRGKSKLPVDIAGRMKRLDAIFRLSDRMVDLRLELKYWRDTLRGLLAARRKAEKKEAKDQGLLKGIAAARTLVGPKGEGLPVDEIKPVADVLDIVCDNEFGVGKMKKGKAKK